LIAFIYSLVLFILTRSLFKDRTFFDGNAVQNDNFKLCINARKTHTQTNPFLSFPLHCCTILYLLPPIISFHFFTLLVSLALSMTKIYHPNVDKLGRICLDILKDKWTPALQIRTVLLSIQALLSAPNPDDPLDNGVAEVWKGDEERALRTAKEWTSMYANLS
jgi:hypothetical protein